MIHRTNRKTPYAAIKIDVLRNGKLSADELGLYTLMMSRTDSWEFSAFVLARELGTSPNEVQDILCRLEQKGFTQQRRGKYGPVWDLYELPDRIPSCVSKTKRDYTIPQTVAEAYTDRLMTEKTNTDEQPLTREQIGKKLISYAAELRKNAEKQKISGLPKRDESGIMNA